jgi:calcineurin-like phosphoesterase family protein
MKRRASRASPAAIVILLVLPAPVAADSWVSVQPATAQPGTTVALRGDGFLPRARMTVAARDLVLGRSRADRRGRFSVSVVAPPGGWQRLRLRTSGGSRKVVSIVARAGAREAPPEGEVASATGARVRWSPTRGLPGDELVLRGSGLKPGARVRVRFAVPGSKAHASRHGVFRWRISIPPGPAGRLRGVVRAGSVALPFDVVVGARPFPLPRPGISPITSPPAPSPSDPVIAGAGDIASSGSGDEATAKLLDGMPDLAAVFTTGDNAYPDGTDANYAAYYEPTWGRHKARTRPVPGNHEYHVGDATGYFTFFADSAGTRAKGWYSYDVGAWHLIALNSSSTGSTCSPVPCGPGSEQYGWLEADLAAHPNKCVLAYWHHPLHSRGNYTPGIAGVKPLWDLLYDNGADLVLNGHDHNYQRFAPMNKAGARDDLLGIREFVIGEGGTNSEYAVQAPGGNLDASQSGTHGVLRLVLHPTSYDWEFVPVAGKTFTDAGSGACH